MMRNLHIYLSALSFLNPALGIRHGSAQLRDLQAFPKFEVQFLNHLPLTEDDAARCQTQGLAREEEWLRHRPDRSGMQHLGDGSEDPSTSEANRLELIRMALVNPASNETQPYLCLMPSASTTAAQNAQAEVEVVHEEIDPVQSWLALSHLDGKCLYAKQGWFTYAYCHNSHLRQFRSAPHAHPHPPGGYIPEEDTTYDAYTLGQARANPRTKPRSSLPHGKAGEAVKGKSNGKAGGETSVDRADSFTHPAVSSSLSGANRYLVQKWSDGTRCDKTGRPRETEVQFHCSMTTNDQIYLIKELAICQYVLIVHSPHLCSLPGFRPEKVDVEPAGIQCRQVLKEDAFRAWEASSGQGDVPSLRPPGLEAAPQPKEIPEVEAPSLKELLKKAIESKQAKLEGRAGVDTSQSGEAGAVDQEVMFISIEEDEDGNAAMVLDTEMLLDSIMAERGEVLEPLEDLGEGRNVELGQQERDMIIKAVKDFLGKKRASSRTATDDEDEERIKDKL